MKQIRTLWKSGMFGVVAVVKNINLGFHNPRLGLNEFHSPPQCAEVPFLSSQIIDYSHLRSYMTNVRI